MQAAIKQGPPARLYKYCKKYYLCNQKKLNWITIIALEKDCLPALLPINHFTPLVFLLNPVLIIIQLFLAYTVYQKNPYAPREHD